MADVICTHHLHVEFGWFAAEKENLRDGGVVLAATLAYLTCMQGNSPHQLTNMPQHLEGQAWRTSSAPITFTLNLDGLQLRRKICGMEGRPGSSTATGTCRGTAMPADDADGGPPNIW
jgi:hypothetical protein